MLLLHGWPFLDGPFWGLSWALKLLLSGPSWAILGPFLGLCGGSRACIVFRPCAPGPAFLGLSPSRACLWDLLKFSRASLGPSCACLWDLPALSGAFLSLSGAFLGLAGASLLGPSCASLGPFLGLSGAPGPVLPGLLWGFPESRASLGPSRALWGLPERRKNVISYAKTILFKTCRLPPWLL